MYIPKLSKKPRKDCNNCRACKHDCFSSNNCDLHFKTGTREVLGYPFSVPMEPCPKPLTYDQYFTCSEVFKGKWETN